MLMIGVCWTSSVSVNFLKNPMVFNSMSSELFFSYMVRALACATTSC